MSEKNSSLVMPLMVCMTYIVEKIYKFESCTEINKSIYVLCFIRNYKIRLHMHKL